MEPEQSHKVELANLRLQVSALAEKISAESLPEQLKALRRTIFIASIGIAVALVLSGVMHMSGAPSNKDLERRIERLEKLQPGAQP